MSEVVGEKMLEGEQLKEFWEHFGFKYLPIRSLPDGKPHSVLKYWLYPDGTAENELPPTSLDNLFKWVVPKTLELIKDKYTKEANADWARWFLIPRFLWKWNENPDDPAQALLQVILDLIEPNRTDLGGPVGSGGVLVRTKESENGG